MKSNFCLISLLLLHSLVSCEIEKKSSSGVAAPKTSQAFQEVEPFNHNQNKVTENNVGDKNSHQIYSYTPNSIGGYPNNYYPGSPETEYYPGKPGYPGVPGNEYYPNGNYPYVPGQTGTELYPNENYPYYPGGSYPGGTYPEGTYPGGTYPGGTYPGGTYPGGTYPGGTYPGGTYPYDTVSSSAFTARRAVPFGSIGQVSRVRFQETVTRVGVGWNEASSEFISPNSGLYFFTFTMMSDRSTNFRVTLRHNNREVVSTFGDINGYQMGTNSAVLLLQAGDRVFLELQEGRLYESTSGVRAYNSFSGFKLFSF